VALARFIAAFLAESRTRGRGEGRVQEIRGKRQLCH
jgi:hypothetical protein